MSHRLGIDKAALLLPTHDIKFDPQFAGLDETDIDNKRNPVTGEPKSRKVLYRDAAGTDVLGKSLKYGKEFQFTIKPGNRTGESISIIQFSGAAFRDNNVQSLSRDELSDVSKAIQSHLREAGVQLDLQTALLYRLDITPTFKMDEPIAHYAPIFTGIGTRKATRKTDFGGTGFYLGNDSWEAAFYDKYRQLMELYGCAEGCAKHTLRPELRFLKSQKLRSVLPVRTLPELRDKWNDMTGVYRTAMEKEIFKPEYRIDRPAALNWAGMAQEASRKERNKWQTFKSDSCAALLVQCMGLDRAKTFVEESFGYDLNTETGKRQIARIHKELSIAAFHLATEGDSVAGTGMRELYRELKSKVLSCAA